nr:hypothetical protein Itr_chr10CG17870 [Ipomoea trifida]
MDDMSQRERAFREGQPRPIALRPESVTPRNELFPLIDSFPNPPRLAVPTAIAANLMGSACIAVAFPPSSGSDASPLLMVDSSSLQIELKSISQRLDTPAQALLSCPPTGRRLKISKRHSSGRTSMEACFFSSTFSPLNTKGALMRDLLREGKYTST